jgi:hypothetical protein
MSSLSDNFATNDLQTLWYNSDSPVTVSGGSAVIPSTTNYYQLASSTAYNLTGSYFSAKISPSSTSGAETDLHLLAGIQIIDGGDEFEARSNRALGVVLVGNGCTPDGHNSVTNELFNGSPVARDNVLRSVKVSSEELANCFGVTFLGQGSETNEVNEKN